jgi:DNA (cytosine-5)-methyltransferase 1
VATYTEKVLSLFSGGGGLDIGFRLAVPNARTICYLEREIQAAAILVKNIQNKFLHDAPIWSDSKTFDSSAWIGKVDWIIGGFPCQPWSLAGKQKGKKDERWLWNDINKIIRTIRPKGIFLENVPGLITGHGIDTILGSLSEIGYNAKWASIKAADVGATHKRERIFILAYKHSLRWSRGNETNEKRSKQQIQTQGSCSEYSSELENSNNSGFYRTQQHDTQQKRQKSIKEQKKQLFSWTRGSSKNKKLDDTTSKGLQRRSKQGINDKERWKTQERQSRSTKQNSIGLYPPNPNSEEWADIIGQYPELSPALEKSAFEPNVRGMVNGLANGLHRADRLRILGNGVVPLQAAYAFRKLIEI